MEEDIIKILEKYNQEHIIRHLKALKSDKKKEIINQISKIDFDELKELYEKANSDREIRNVTIEPIKVMKKHKISDSAKKTYIEKGEEILEQNKFAVVTMAGGQGTRLGHNGPKGTFKIDLEPEAKYLFEILVDRLKKASEEYGKVIPYYIMTSKENNNDTVDFFEEKNYFNYPKESIKFFEQSEEPLISKEGKLLIGENNLIKFASNGNGEIYKSMKKNGILEDMRQKGIEWILITGIDNILAKVADPLFIGITIEKNDLIASKSVVKNSPTESGGVFAKANGNPGIIEYVEIPEEVATKTDENGDFLYADINIVNHLFKIEALEELSKKRLPYHIAVKKCKCLNENGDLVEEKVYKFEKFIFDGFTYFDDMTLLRVKREYEFAPIKNAEGKDSPKTAKKLYEDYEKILKND